MGVSQRTFIPLCVAAAQALMTLIKIPESAFDGGTVCPWCLWAVVGARGRGGGRRLAFPMAGLRCCSVGDNVATAPLVSLP
jgi:hypothetical protein